VNSALRKGHGEPLIFLHGIGGGGRSFQRQLDALSDQFDCIAWDAPGYGGAPQLASTTFETLSAALARSLDDLKLASAHVVGHSLGGMIAQDFVARYPARVRSLILSCTSPAFGRPDGDWQKQFIAARLDPIDGGMTMEDNARGLMPSLMPGARPDDLAMAIACMAEVPIPTYRAIVHCLVTFDRRAALPDIAVPTLVLAAENDRAAPAPVLEKMASKIPGARYVCLPQVGHLAYLENPKAFNEEIRDFVAGVQNIDRGVQTSRRSDS
jgi:pimeloyl-ACP methyl ester carboxylesterase